MTNSQELRMNQSLSLVLTPEMRQSLSVLQMSCMELREFVNKELTENPLLEANESVHMNTTDTDIQKISWTSYIKSCNSSLKSPDRTDSNDEDPYTFEKYFHTGQSYHEVLDIQFDLLKLSLSPRQTRIGYALLDQINDDGYLYADLDDLAADLNVYREEIDEILSMIQKFYPSGTAARSVEECLFLQLKDCGLLTEEYRILLFHHLEAVADHRFRQVEKESGISIQVQSAFLRDLKGLHPRPGNQFERAEKNYYVIPDGSIEWAGASWNVSLNSIGTPPLIINPTYRKMLDDQTLPSQTRDYILERMNRAITLIHNIESREQTIKSITSTIADQQTAYLLGKTNSLKSLTQKQIAQITGFHESTISRTVREKYFYTPRGTLELKSLFCSSFEKDGISIPANAIKKEIAELVDGEDPSHPLTDQQIASLLSADSLDIARRTVAKYREEMHIRSASRRKLSSSVHL